MEMKNEAIDDNEDYAVDCLNAVLKQLRMTKEELEQHDGFVLTKEDHLNIQKWQTSTSIMIQGKMRLNYSQSERDTSEKLKRIVDVAFIRKGEVLGKC